jgi:hypothetical protein
MGGAAGHMAHPFNIVQSGKELHNLFERAYNHVQQNPAYASVKIDGLNASVKLVKGSTGHAKEFALDRGSNKPLDVSGVCKNDLETRFGKGHGLANKAGVVLDILNASIPVIKQELIHVGMWDNPNILLNIEYVERKSNVQDYGCNFLAIHGLLESFYATQKRRATHEIDYASITMNRLINKLNSIACDYNFKVLGAVNIEAVEAPDFEKELNQTYTIRYSKQTSVTKTLRDWLYAVEEVPHNKSFMLSSGKKVEALSKEVFIDILGGAVLSEYLEDPLVSFREAVNGFVCYLATMKLGEAFLSVYTSALGNVNEQEGVVIRGLTENPFKITGGFILRGMQSTFQK